MLDTPKSTRDDNGPKATASQGAATTLPETIRAKLMAEANPAGPVGEGLSVEGALAPVSSATFGDRLKGGAASVGRATRQSAAALASWRPNMQALRKIQVPQIPVDVREGIVKHGKRAGLNVGATIDSIIRNRPNPATLDAVPASGEPDVATSDIRTERLRRDVRQPSIFAPGHILTALLAGGIIHIATTFAITTLGTGSAYRQLRGALPANEMVVLPPQMPGAQLLPFLMPDMLYAICRFDLTGGIVEVNAILPEAGWSLALYTRQGDNFYAAPGQSQRPVRVAFMLAPTTDRLVNLTPGARKADVDMSQVTSPDSQGLIVIRAPLKGVAFEGTAKADLKRASCAPSRR